MSKRKRGWEITWTGVLAAAVEASLVRGTVVVEEALGPATNRRVTLRKKEALLLSVYLYIS